MKEKCKTYLCFQLKEQNVLIPIELVNIVLPLPELQKIPTKKNGFVGVLNYHGTAIAVYDLLKLTTGKYSIEAGIDTPLLVVQKDSRNVGFLVTFVEGLVDIDTDKFQPTIKGTEEYVAAIYETETKNAWIIDLDKLINNFELNMVTEDLHG